MSRLGIATLAILVAACASVSDDKSAEVTVFAASSLTDAFQSLETEFERVNPTANVKVNFAGSQVLRLQIEQGAKADIFVSANAQHMRALETAGLVATSTTFATNELVVATRCKSGCAQRFSDLANNAKIVIGADNVPIGIYTRHLFARAEPVVGREVVAAIERNVVSKESNVRLVRAKVELGEADAAIVYRSDVVASNARGGGDWQLVPLPPGVRVSAAYWIGRLSDTQRNAPADAFLSFLSSARGQSILRKHGFSTPRS